MDDLERLSRIKENLRDAKAGLERLDGFTEGSLYELAVALSDSHSPDEVAEAARDVIPSGDLVLLADFCRIYCKYFGKDDAGFEKTDIADNPYTVAIPEIPKLKNGVELLKNSGFRMECEYGDSFNSCAEDVSFGNSTYVLMPYSDPEEGRFRAFTGMRQKYGLKLHTVLYVAGDDGEEYGYQLCSLGYIDDNSLPYTRLSFTSETATEPICFLQGAECFGAKVMSAEFDSSPSRNTINAVLNIEELDGNTVSGLMMYLNAVSDLAVNGIYAELHK